MSWMFHHHHHHQNHHTRPSTYIGRVGALAVALGIESVVIGTTAVANADTDDSATGNPDTSQTSSASTEKGPRGATKTGAAAIRAPGSGARGARHPLTASAVAPRSTSDSAPGLRPTPVVPMAVSINDVATPPPADFRVTLPTATASTPVAAAVAAVPMPVPVVPRLAASATTAALHPEPLPTVTIASPPAARATIAAAITDVLAALSDAISGGGPTVPADAAVGAMMAATRRGRTATLAPTAAATSTTSTTTSVEAESMALSPSTGGKVVTDLLASNKSALVLTSNTTASTMVSLPDSTALVIRAKATLNSGAPNMTLAVDGVPVTTVVVKGTSWSDYTFLGVIPAGSHTISIATSNSTARRSLYLDKVATLNGPYVEEFNGATGAAPSSAIWTAKTGSGWDPGIETYQTSNATLDGQGHLALRATKSKNSYYSGWVDTKNKVSYGYGTITARIKVPKGQGLWPAFWLKGANEDTVAWPASGEIDVMELPSTATTMYSTLHGPIAGSTATQQAQIVSTVPDLSTDYHNYWVRHLPNEITFGVDGTTLGTLTPSSLSAGSQWVYNRPMHVLLNLAVGGSWAGAPNSSTPFPSSMLVDWVRWDPPA